MSKVSGDKFLDSVRISGLIEAERLQKAVAEYQSLHGEIGEADAAPLVDWFIEQKLLTRWQTDNLLKGKHKGFFLGKHKLLDHIGSGGMSSVYLAENVSMQRIVAVKVLPPNRVEDSSYLARFYREARAAAKLIHPNIVHTYDIDHENKTHYLILEYVEGRDLYQMVKKDGPLAYEVAADYIRQAADGLAFAHQTGLIHRDVKPANLLVDTRGVVKVLDLGLARFTEETQSSLTVAHDENVLGTADYLAPEQAVNSHKVDTRADIYSLGCTLYFLLTGHPPFPEGTLPERLLKHQTEQPRPIEEERRDIPRDLVHICGRMMAKNVKRRFQTATDVSHALTQWLSTRSEASGKLAAAVTATGQAAAATRFGARRPAMSGGPQGGILNDLGEGASPSSDKNLRGPPTPKPGKGQALTDTVANLQRAARGAGQADPSESGKSSGIGKGAAGKGADSAKGRGRKLPVARSLDAPSGDLVFDTGEFRALGNAARHAPHAESDKHPAKAKAEPGISWVVYAVSALGILSVVVLIVLIMRS